MLLFSSGPRCLLATAGTRCRRRLALRYRCADEVAARPNLHRDIQELTKIVTRLAEKAATTSATRWGRRFIKAAAVNSAGSANPDDHYDDQVLDALAKRFDTE